MTQTQTEMGDHCHVYKYCKTNFDGLSNDSIMTQPQPEMGYHRHIYKYCTVKHLYIDSSYM